MKTCFYLGFLFCFSLHSGAQKDTSFWFIAPDISAVMGDTAIKLHFQTYSLPSVIYISQPANPAGISTSVSVPGNTLFTLNLSASLSAVESSPTNSVSNKGIYISSKEEISVYYSLGAANNREMISLKGQRALGTDFYVPIPTSTAVLTEVVPDGGVGFDVVATQTGVTTILITPRANCVGRSKNITFLRTLNYGQSFSVRDNNAVNPSELSGSIVSADKPVAVTINGPVKTSSTCASYFADQITSSDNIGKDYVVLKGKSSVDIAYLLAPLNATGFTVTSANSNYNWLINSGETYSVVISDTLTYIHCDKPVYLLHASGYGCKLSAAQLPPAYCAGSYTTAFTRLNADSLHLNIFTRSGFQNSFTLTCNSATLPIPSSAFTTVPGSGGALVAARLYFSTLNIPVGSNNQLKNSADLFGLSVQNGGSGSGSTYASASEFAVKPFVYANIIPTATICTNTQFTLNGIVGGGPLTGNWNVLNGFGTLSGPASQLTNNIYTPNPVDTNISPVRIVLSSTGICPNQSDTLKLTVKQPPIVTAGFDFISCSNNPSIQLNGNVYGATNQGIWQVLSPGNGTFAPGTNTYNPVYSISASDKLLNQLRFVLTSTNNAGCNPGTDTILVQMNHPATVTAAPSSPILKCVNNASVFLNGSISGTTTSTGVWSSSGSGLFIPNNLSLISSYIPSVQDILNGAVWLKLSSTNNQQCLPVHDSVQIVFTQAPSVNAGLDLNSCINNPIVELNASIGGTVTNTGIWYGGAGTFSPTNSALSTSYIATPAEVSNGSVALTFSSTNNGLCLGASDQVIVNFQGQPTANFQVAAVCLNQNTVFHDASYNASSLATVNGWYWNFGDGSALNSNANPVHVYPAAGLYTIQLVVRNSFNCYDTTEKTVEIYTLPAVSFSINRACTGSAQQIMFTDLSTIALPDVIPANGYYWDFGGFGTSGTQHDTIVFPSAGVYNITHVVTSNHNCSASLSNSILITPRPEARFTYTNNALPGLGASVQFRDTSNNAHRWHWAFGNGDTSNLQDPIENYSSNGTYTVTLTVYDVFGCPSVFTSTVLVENVVSSLAELIPNMITPNSDGKNDIWRLDFIQVFYPKAVIEVFNIWGMKLFHSEGYSNAWDGSYKGDPLPVGTYFYTIQLNDGKDTPVYKGSITLLK
ncbi:MAG TPA: PKD domain-containing protein [Bacteroidia bacterium]|nr:PKD domain-containing protein [Bacteroidia bacterium]